MMLIRESNDWGADEGSRSFTDAKKMCESKGMRLPSKAELTERHYDLRFKQLINKLSSLGQIVILIDEYDKPIIDYITKPELAVEMREILKGFYTIIKASDEYIRFVLLTGVSKFSRAGVFSGECEKVYNPFSTLLLFDKKEFKNYWFETGTPSFLIELSKKKDFAVTELPIRMEEIFFFLRD